MFVDQDAVKGLDAKDFDLLAAFETLRGEIHATKMPDSKDQE